MKLALMLMAGSALVLVGLLGLYFNTSADNGIHTFDICRGIKYRPSKPTSTSADPAISIRASFMALYSFFHYPRFQSEETLE